MIKSGFSEVIFGDPQSKYEDGYWMKHMENDEIVGSFRDTEYKKSPNSGTGFKKNGVWITSGCGFKENAEWLTFVAIKRQPLYMHCDLKWFQ